MSAFRKSLILKAISLALVPSFIWMEIGWAAVDLWQSQTEAPNSTLNTAFEKRVASEVDQKNGLFQLIQESGDEPNPPSEDPDSPYTYYQSGNLYKFYDAQERASYYYYDEDYDGAQKGRLWKRVSDYGDEYQLEYWGESNTVFRKKTFADGVLKTTDEYYQSGNQKYSVSASSGTIYEFYDESFEGQSAGRLKRLVSGSGEQYVYASYYENTFQAKTSEHYLSDGSLESRCQFDTNGRLTVLEDSSGARRLYTYHANGRTESYELWENGFFSFRYEYDDRGRIVFQNDSSGRRVFIEYWGDSSRRKAVCSYEGERLIDRYTYFESGNYESLYRFNSFTQYFLDEKRPESGYGRLARQVFLGGTEHLYAYWGETDTVFTREVLIGGESREIHEFYENGNEKSITYPRTGTVYEFYDETFESYGRGRMKSLRFGNGEVYRFISYHEGTYRYKTIERYNSDGTLSSISEQNLAGYVTSVKYPNGNKFLYDYYENSRYKTIEQWRDGSFLMRTEYESSGRTLRQEYANGRITYYQYWGDSKIRKDVSSYEGATLVSRQTFYASGNYESTYDLNGYLQYFMDEGTPGVGFGRLISRATGDGSKSVYTYWGDTSRCKTLTQYEAGGIFHMTFGMDQAGMTVYRKSADGWESWYTYYPGTVSYESMLIHKDGKFDKEFLYYESGNIKRAAYADNQIYEYYDDAHVVNQRGRVKSYTYASGARIEFAEYWGDAATVKTRREYDAEGNLLGVYQYLETGEEEPIFEFMETVASEPRTTIHYRVAGVWREMVCDLEEGFNDITVTHADLSGKVYTGQCRIYMDPAVSTSAEEVRSGASKVDRWGNARDLYDRDLLVDERWLQSENLEIEAPCHGAELPSLNFQFIARLPEDGGDGLLIETGFEIPGTFDGPYTAQGTIRFVIEDGFFKLKIRSPQEQTVDDLTFRADMESVVILDAAPEEGALYELGMEFTEQGLEVYLDRGERKADSEPLHVIEGIRSIPRVAAQTHGSTLQAVRIYGGTREIRYADGAVMSVEYSKDDTGDLRERICRIAWPSDSETAPPLSGTIYSIQQYDAEGRVTYDLGTDGSQTRYAYEDSGRIARVESPDGRILQITYETLPDEEIQETRVLDWEDDFGNVVHAVSRILYEASGRILRIDHADGGVTEYAYSGDGRSITADYTDALARYRYSAGLTLDESGRLARTFGRDGDANYTYTLSEDGSLEAGIRQEFEDGGRTYVRSTRVVTDVRGRRIISEDAQGRTETFEYDDEGDLVRYVDADGRVTLVDYTKNEDGAILTERETLSYTDDFGNVISAVTIRGYDAYGHVTQEINPDKTAYIHEYLYTGDNHTVGRRTSCRYDHVASLDELAAAHQNTVSSVVSETEWDAHGGVIFESDGNGTEITYIRVYGDGGRLLSLRQITSVDLPGGPVTSTTETEYDLKGNLLAETDLYGNQIRYEYSLDGQLMGVTESPASDSGGEYTLTTTYAIQKTTDGRVVSRTALRQGMDGYGNRIDSLRTETYGVDGRLKRIDEPDGTATEYKYELGDDGKPVSRTVYYHQDSESSVFGSVGFGGIAGLLHGLDNSKETYDAWGDVVALKTRDLKSTAFVLTRDDTGLIRRVEQTDSWVEGPEEDAVEVAVQSTSEYDGRGRMIEFVDGEGRKTAYEYGAMGALRRVTRTSEFAAGDEPAGTYVTITEYQRILEASGRLTEEWETTTGTDGFGLEYRQTQITAYDEWGSPVMRLDADGVGTYTEIEYDATGSIREERVYEYKGVWNLEDLANAHASAVAENMVRRTTYDSLGAIVESQNAEGMKVRVGREYSANGVLQIETRTISSEGGEDKVLTDVYDAYGRNVRQTDSLGYTTEYIYAADGSLLKTVQTGPEGYYRLETAREVARFADGADQKVTETTTGMDRYARQIDEEIYREWDRRGDLIASADVNGTLTTVEREYNPFNRLAKETVSVTQDGAEEPQVVIKTFDIRGRMIAEEEPGVEKTIYDYTVDESGRIRRVSQTDYSNIGRDGRIVESRLECRAASAGDRPASITVGGTVLNPPAGSGDGIWMAVLAGGDPSQLRTEFVPADASEDLAVFLEGLSPEDVLLLATEGDVRSLINADTAAAMALFGSRKIEALAQGGTLTFIGTKAQGDGVAVECYGHPGELSARTQNTSTQIREYDEFGYLVRYQDGSGGVFDYVRAYDGSALWLTERDADGYVRRVTDYSGSRDEKGRMDSTSAVTTVTVDNTLDDPEKFFGQWDAESNGVSFSGGSLIVTPGEDGWIASIFDAHADERSFSGTARLEEGAALIVYLRYVSAAEYLAVEYTGDQARLIVRSPNTDTQTSPEETTLALAATDGLPPAEGPVFFNAAIAQGRVVFEVNGTQLLSADIAANDLVPAAGRLAFCAKGGEIEFEGVRAGEKTERNRDYLNDSEIRRRVDENGVITDYDEDGDIVQITDPVNHITKTYQIQKYATGILRYKKEIISMTARNTDGEEVTTSVASESFYDSEGRLTRYIDNEGGSTYYDYYSNGETRSVTFPDGKRVEYAYAPSTEDPAHRVTTERHERLTRDDLGRAILDTDGNPVYELMSTVTKEHDAEGDLVRLAEDVAQAGVTKEVFFAYVYHSGAERNLASKTSRFVYREKSADASGAVVSEYTTLEEADTDGNLIRSVDAEGVIREYVYRELVTEGGGENLKRILTITETRPDQVITHHYAYS
ncbi:MAG: hypothetical protein HQL11_00715, partial [Candidatus Omnitrophica bacterium]|nr:hypothetical protein [Candidatus Omnitrophota bacterium]